MSITKMLETLEKIHRGELGDSQEFKATLQSINNEALNVAKILKKHLISYLPIYGRKLEIEQLRSQAIALIQTKQDELNIDKQHIQALPDIAPQSRDLLLNQVAEKELSYQEDLQLVLQAERKENILQYIKDYFNKDNEMADEFILALAKDMLGKDSFSLFSAQETQFTPTLHFDADHKHYAVSVGGEQAQAFTKDDGNCFYLAVVYCLLQHGNYENNILARLPIECSRTHPLQNGMRELEGLVKNAHHQWVEKNDNHQQRELLTGNNAAEEPSEQEAFLTFMHFLTPEKNKKSSTAPAIQGFRDNLSLEENIHHANHESLGLESTQIDGVLDIIKSDYQHPTSLFQAISEQQKEYRRLNEAHKDGRPYQQS